MCVGFGVLVGVAVGKGVGVLVTVAVDVDVGTGVCVGVAVGVGTGVAVSGGTAVGVSSARAIGAGVAVGGGVSSPHEISRATTTPAKRSAPIVFLLARKRFMRSLFAARIVEIVVSPPCPVKRS